MQGALQADRRHHRAQHNYFTIFMQRGRRGASVYRK
jgi:hypothetical protein